jgi:hypothetical protein
VTVNGGILVIQFYRGMMKAMQMCGYQIRYSRGVDRLRENTEYRKVGEFRVPRRLGAVTNDGLGIRARCPRLASAESDKKDKEPGNLLASESHDLIT